MQAIRNFLDFAVKGEYISKDDVKPLYIFFRINGKVYEMQGVDAYRRDVLIQLLEKYNAKDIIKYTLTFTVDLDKGYMTLDDGSFFKINYDINKIKIIGSLEDCEQQQILRDLVTQFFDRPNRYFMRYEKSNESEEIVSECTELLHDPTIDSYTFDDKTVVVSISEDSGKLMRNSARGLLTLLGVGTAIVGAGCFFAISYMRRHRT